MMSKYKDNWFAWATAGAVWFLVGVLLLTLAVWFYPRNTIDITFFTDQKSVKVGEVIAFESHIVSQMEADSVYTTHLQCGAKSYIIATLNAPTTVRNFPSASENTIPNFVEPSDDCVMRLTGKHSIAIAPFLHRVYDTEFFSNTFDVTK